MRKGIPCHQGSSNTCLLAGSVLVMLVTHSLPFIMIIHCHNVSVHLKATASKNLATLKILFGF